MDYRHQVRRAIVIAPQTNPPHHIGHDEDCRRDIMSDWVNYPKSCYLLSPSVNLDNTVDITKP
ncbi:hypothetical protein LC607_29405 [Nostoc sp. CHAB 5824]|nr:hypothetical protein [Nostoc sp. CHAB 5824]